MRVIGEKERRCETRIVFSWLTRGRLSMRAPARSALFLNKASGFQEEFAFRSDFEPPQRALAQGIFVFSAGVETNLFCLENSAALLNAFPESTQQALETFALFSFYLYHNFHLPY
jgi:hypothetical protein